MPSLRHLMALGVAALSLLGGGCAIVQDGACLTAYRMKEAVGDCAESARNHKWAEQAWKNVLRACPQVCYSDDYAVGFRDGFSEYLYRGGNGEPPPLPPKHYRSVAYQTPAGYKAIEDWFAGYRHGTTAAREGGFRQYVTGPTGMHGPPPVSLPIAVESAQETLPPVEVPLEPPPQTSTHARITGVHSMPDQPAAAGSVPDAPPQLETPPPPARARITGVHAQPDPPVARPDT